MADEFKYDVFLSHSAKDKAVVRPLAERLRNDGLRVWFDEWEIHPGDNIPAKIEDGLTYSRVLVLCMSANASGADWTELESQTFRFRDPLGKDRRFIPLRLDDTPLKGSLALFSYINWLPADRDQGYTSLLNACCPRTPLPPGSNPGASPFDVDKYTAHVLNVHFESDKIGGASTLVDPRSMFVRTKCAPLSGKDEPAAAMDAFAWLNERALGPLPALVLSNYGMGKSHLVLRWFVSLGQRAATGLQERLPVFFPLRSLPSNYLFMDRPEFLRQIWTTPHSEGFPLPEFEQFCRGLEEGRFWMILDGIDEIPMVQIARDSIAIVRKLRSLIGENCPQLYTSRWGMFAARMEELAGDFGSRVCSLLPWDDEQWETFLDSCRDSRIFTSGKEYEAFRDRVAASPHLRMLRVTPLYARMLVEARDTLRQEKPLDVAALYERYVSVVLRRRPMYGIDDGIRVKCLQATAAHLCRSRLSKVGFNEVERIASELADAAGLADIKRILEHDVKTCSLLTSGRTGQLEFSHKSFYDYFVATTLLQELREGFPWTQAKMLKIPLEEDILLFAGILLARAEHKELKADCVMELRSARMALLETSIVRNLVKVLLSAQCNLSGAQLRNASLSGLDLSACEMDGALFEGAFLDSCNFAQSKLRGCQFVGTMFTNSRFADGDFTGSSFKGCRMEALNKSGFAAKLANVVLVRATMSRQDGRLLEAALLQSDGWESEKQREEAIATMKRTARWTDG